MSIPVYLVRSPFIILNDLQTIVNLKKLKGDDNAYRLGDYRIGFYFDGETVTFARVLHRKDIYRYFPP
ncbi:MAG: type II toxin-antitoxin system RelE family toxin [Microcoleus sp.]